MFILANSFKPAKVVFSFKSANDISINNLAIHSSAKAFDTTSTPVKSNTTLLFDKIVSSKD